MYYPKGFSVDGVALTGLVDKLVAQAIESQAGRFDVFARFEHRNFPSGKLLRMPSLAIGMAYCQLRGVCCRGWAKCGHSR